MFIRVVNNRDDSNMGLKPDSDDTTKTSETFEDRYRLYTSTEPLFPWGDRAFGNMTITNGTHLNLNLNLPPSKFKSNKTKKSYDNFNEFLENPLFLKPFCIWDSDEESEDIEDVRCQMCRKKIVIGDNGEFSQHNDKPICKTYSLHGCQVKLREVFNLSESLHKSTILREANCNLKPYIIVSATTDKKNKKE